MKMNDIYEKVSKKLYDYFVINSSVVALQHEDGRYVALKTPITVDMINMMLIGGYSIGTYQQQLFNDKLKWICFDFDTKKKIDNDKEVMELKEKYVMPFITKLTEKNISFLVEFSGRRGYHIWIFFNQIISKDLAYTITNYLIGDMYNKIKSEEKFGIDLFPKTQSGKVPNKYGLQVKLPLSKHKSSGTYSYFIKDVSLFNVKRIYKIDEDFLEEQYEILNQIKENEVSTLLKNCKLETKISKDYLIDYHKQIINSNVSIDLGDIKKAFCSDSVLCIVWNHISLGTLDSFERILLLGIFGHMNCGEEILEEIFKLQNNYNKIVTKEMIAKYRNYIFPVTFKYIYQYFHFDNCPEEKTNTYIDDYIFDYLEIITEKYELPETEKYVNFVKGITEKEINYFYYNDEVYDFDTLYKMKSFTYYDFSNIEQYINRVEKGEQPIPNTIEYKKYVRKETDKERILVSLGAKERVITTALINKLIMYCQKDYNSYSYHLNMGLDGDVFYPWISSWTRYKNDISQYFSVPFFEDFVCIKVDFKQFYDSIYPHSILREMKDKECNCDKDKFLNNIYVYLLGFNERLMLDIRNTIQGVPQGPAYARVLAELTINELLEQFLLQNDEFSELKIYRYVDDMFVFGFKEELIDSFIIKFSAYFESKNLFLNKTKTKKYGKIKELLPEDKYELQEFREFNYDIFQLRDSRWADDFDKEKFDTQYLRFIYRRKAWDINDANLIFSNKIDDIVKEKYYEQFYNKIISSKLGRGSLFRKFYDYIFADDVRTEIFMKNKEFVKVPQKSINEANLVCSMIVNFSNMQNYISVNNLDSLKMFCSCNMDKNKCILLELIKNRDEVNDDNR